MRPLFLLAAEIALTVVLLVGAGLMIKGVHNLVKGEPMLEPRTLLTLRLELDASEYRTPEKVEEFYRQVLERTAGTPGRAGRYRSIGAAIQQACTLWRVYDSGQELQPGTQPTAQIQAVSPDYLRTMHIPLRAGRFLGERDGPGSPIVSRNK